MVLITLRSFILLGIVVAFTKVVNNKRKNTDNVVRLFQRLGISREMKVEYMYKKQTSFINGHYADHIAQASCAASFSGGFVSAIRRDCGSKKTCATICREGISSMRAIYGNQGSSTAYCFNAFHFYYGHPNLHPKTRGRAFMAMYRYGSGACHSAFCGPNFCCCRA